MPEERSPGRPVTHEPPAARNAADDTAKLIYAAVDDVARTKERRSAIAAAEAAKTPLKPRATLAATIVAFVVLGILFVTNMQGVSLLSFLRPSPPPAVARQQAGDALRQVVDGIELFRKDYAELPGSLVEIGTPVDGNWSYAASGSHYQVALKYHGQVVTFDSRTTPVPNAQNP